MLKLYNTLARPMPQEPARARALGHGMPWPRRQARACVISRVAKSHNGGSAGIDSTRSTRDWIDLLIRPLQLNF